jgi:hypothetical protein
LKGWAKFKPPLRAEDQRLPDFLSGRLLQQSRLDAKAKRFEAIEWSGEPSGELVNLRDRFEQRDKSSRLRGDKSAQDSLGPFDEDIPALIVPFPFLPTDKPQSGNPLPSGFTIIKLDLNYLQRQFIPSLIQRK